MNNFQNAAPLMPLQRLPNGLPQLQGPPQMPNIPQADVQPPLIARYRGGQRQLIRNPLYVPGAQPFPQPAPLLPIPQAQPAIPSYHPSAGAAPEPPSKVPTRLPSQHQSSSASPQSSQRSSSQYQSSQREASSYSTFAPPPPYKTMAESSSQRPSSQREASSHSTLKPPPPSSQPHRSTKSSERPSETSTKAVKTENYKLGGMGRTIVEGQVASSSPSKLKTVTTVSKTATAVSKTHGYRLGKMERTIVEGQVPSSKTKEASGR